MDTAARNVCPAVGVPYMFMFSFSPWHFCLYVPLNLAGCLTYTVSLPLCANVSCSYADLMSICSMCMRYVAAIPNSFLTVVLSAMYVVVFEEL